MASINSKRWLKVGAAIAAFGLSVGAEARSRAEERPAQGNGQQSTAQSRLPSFNYGGPITDQALLRNNNVIEVKAKVVDVRGSTMFLDVGGPVVRAELGSLTLKRTPRSGEAVIAHLTRGDGLKNDLLGLWTEAK